ncbi:MAG: metal ABC transporter substrate-binding protein [Clostridium sp.]
MKKVTFFLLAVTIFMFIGLGQAETTLSANTEGGIVDNREIYLNIMTTNKCQYYLVKDIVKDKHNVQYMLSNEEDINKFEFSEGIINNVSNMDLFLYTGNGFEPWMNGFIDTLKKGNLGIINISRGIRTSTIKKGDKSVENPYYWLGIEEYKIALYNVKSAIQDRDPKNRQFYEDNYNEAIREIDELNKTYKLELEKLSEHKFIVVGDSFDYLLNNLKLDYIKTYDGNISTVIKENKLNPEQVIVIKDSEDLIELDKLLNNVVTLQNFDCNKSFKELIYYNINILVNINL